MARRACVLVLSLTLLALQPGTSAHADARFFGSMGGQHLNSPVVGMAATPSGNGYWLVAADGGMFAFGDTRFVGSTGGLALVAPIVGMAATPSGNGYWLVASDGGLFAFGDARFFGSTGGLALVAPIVGMASTPSGNGYWLVASDGGLFAFGDARFFGSLGGQPQTMPVSGIAATPAGDGYWMVLRDGRVFAFGAAPHLGDAGSFNLLGPVTEIVATPTGGGYWLAADEGGVFAFGDARYFGSTGGGALVAGIVGFATRPGADGYWFAAADGGVFAFPGPQLPPRRVPALDVQVAVDGLTNPWDIAFLPKGEMLFTERGGRVSAVVNGDRRVLAQIPDVRAVGEAGLMGIAAHPAFGSNRRIYTCFASLAGDVKVVEWEVDAAVRGLTRVRDLVGGLPQSVSGRHSGCRIRFGNDGMLWITAGDTAVGTRPQNLADEGGKVLRVDARTGGAAPGNPFGSRIYTYGHRNPQGLAFRPAAPQAFSVEHGPDRDDEVNRLVGGTNYGWDPVPGYNERVPMTDFGKFPNAKGPVWKSGAPPIAPSGATFLSGPQWGTWNGALAFTALRGHQMRVLQLTADGESNSSDTVVLTNFGRLRAPVQGPDGALYVTTDNGGGGDVILRVTPR